MYILILILVFILARIIFRGLFSKTWKEKTQDIIYSIENENKFWHLMGQEINAEKVFFAYLRTRNQRDYIRVGDCVMDTYNENEVNKNDLDLKKFKKDRSIKVINNILNPKIEEKEKNISDYFTDNKITLTEDEIRKSFKKFEEDSWIISDVTKHYSGFMPAHLNSLIKSDKTGISIWQELKKFVDEEHNFEFNRSGTKHVDFLESLKMVQNELYSFIIDLLCEKFENKEKSEKIKKLLREWQQLHMLRWCVVDYASMMNLSIISEKIWRFVIFVFL